MLVDGGAIKTCLAHCASNCRRRAWTASAYCTREAFQWLAKLNTAPQLDKRLVVRWQPTDLQQGASDLAVWEIAQEFGWKLYINQQLHAKAYLFDDLSLTGSANLTSRGIALAGQRSNLEILRYREQDHALEAWFDSLFACSRLVDELLIQSIRAQLRTLPATLPDDTARFEFSPIDRPSLTRLTPSDLLQLPDPSPLLSTPPAPSTPAAQHDAAMLAISPPCTRETLAIHLMTSKLYSWLSCLGSPKLHFGELTAALHDEIAASSPISRLTIKAFATNIFGWAKALPELFETGRANHSEHLAIRHPIDAANSTAQKTASR